MYKIAVIGDKDSALAFRALGVDVYTAYEKDETRRTIDRLADEGYGVIYLSEKLSTLIPETLERYKAKPVPAMILIPSSTGSLGIGKEKILENVVKAVGSNIL